MKCATDREKQMVTYKQKNKQCGEWVKSDNVRDHIDWITYTHTFIHTVQPKYDKQNAWEVAGKFKHGKRNKADSLPLY